MDEPFADTLNVELVATVLSIDMMTATQKKYFFSWQEGSA